MIRIALIITVAAIADKETMTRNHVCGVFPAMRVTNVTKISKGIMNNVANN